MKKTTKNVGKAQNVQTIAASTNNISYVVTHQIIQIDQDRKATTIVDEVKHFRGERAIDCRMKAFNYAFQLTQDANIDGKLCKEHLDSVPEAFAKQMRNITTLSIEIDCIDNKTGDRIAISEADFFEPPDECLGELIAELMWYREYGYETDNWVVSIKNNRRTWEILNYCMIDLFGLMSNPFAA